MHRKHFVVHHGSNWKVVKHISEQLPHLRITILLLALSVESIDLRDCPGLMVAPDQAYSIRVPQFKNHQKGNGLNTMRSSINVVAHEQVVGVRAVAANSKKLNYIIKLPVDVAHTGDWRSKLNHVIFFGKDVFNLRTDQIYCCLRKFLAFFSLLNVLIDVKRMLVFCSR